MKETITATIVFCDDIETRTFKDEMEMYVRSGFGKVLFTNRKMEGDFV
jgi:hypothetical protein